MPANELLARTIAGEIVIAKRPGAAMKKWRELFGVTQGALARELRISPSVLSDYEAGRRNSPGAAFVRNLVRGLIKIDAKTGTRIVQKISDSAAQTPAIMAQYESKKALDNRTLIRAIHGRIIANKKEAYENKLYGYTLIDSLQAILSLSEQDFKLLYGRNKKRALIFTKVQLGRSPMIAVKVTNPKPSMVVLHGLAPDEVDALAKKIATIEKIPLIVSQIEKEEELVKKLAHATM